MICNFFEKLRQTAFFTFNKEVSRVIKPDAVELKIVNPVKTDITDKLLRASLVKIQIIQTTECPPEFTYIRASFNILVEPPVREISRLIIKARNLCDVIEYPIHNDLDSFVMKLTY